MIVVLLIVFLIAFLLAGWVLTLLGLPGNWLMVVATATYVYLVPADSCAAIDWKIIVVLLILATLGEVIELVTGAAGAARAGASKRGAVLALLGSIAGALLGIFIGLPIPVLGPIFAALLFAGLGAMAGAMLGESWAGRDAGATWRIGQAAFWARLLGTLGKILIGGVMVAIVLAALLF